MWYVVGGASSRANVASSPATSELETPCTVQAESLHENGEKVSHRVDVVDQPKVDSAVEGSMNRVR